MAPENPQPLLEPQPLLDLDPRTGEVIASVPQDDLESVRSAVRQSRAVAEDWAGRPAAERGTLLRQAADALERIAGELAAENARETGRRLEGARGGVEAGIGTLRQYAELGPVDRGHSLRGADRAVDYTREEPRGLVVAITPWNDPVAIACGLIGAALVTGNVVIHKPSEHCPRVGAMLGEAISSALPPDVLSTVLGDGSVGAMLTAEPGVDAIAHVGSSATGERIVRAAALTRAHVVLENGGNDALVVDADVDPVWAAHQAALGAFENSGQLCTSVERIFVHEAVAEPFLRALVERAEQLERSAELGPLVDGALRSRVHEHVTEAIARGARLLCGGVVPDGPGSYYPPTVLADCEPGMRIMQEETFGPVAPVQIVPDFATGLELANADVYGLSATVLTASLAHAQRAAAELNVGTVKVNAVFGGAPGGSAVPRGASGTGHGYGPELLREFTRTKVVHLGAPGLR